MRDCVRSLVISNLSKIRALISQKVIIFPHPLGAEVIQDVHWGVVCANAILGVVFNFAINFGIAYTFPLFISLGTILGIPINALFDIFFRSVDLANWKITAMDLIIGGFLLILVPPDSSEWIHRKISFLCSKCCCCSHKKCASTGIKR